MQSYLQIIIILLYVAFRKCVRGAKPPLAFASSKANHPDRIYRKASPDIPPAVRETVAQAQARKTAERPIPEITESLKQKPTQEARS